MRVCIGTYADVDDEKDMTQWPRKIIPIGLKVMDLVSILPHNSPRIFNEGRDDQKPTDSRQVSERTA